MNNHEKDQRFDDGASVRPDFRYTGQRIQPNKIAQLCAQIRHALELAVGHAAKAGHANIAKFLREHGGR
jgi:hypothetical protein